jgi:phage N-6-adenine-methyltransferase
MDSQIKHIGGIQNEWYTPKNIIDKVKYILGEIDIDPASCEVANKVVDAKQYFTSENSGLDKEWKGKVFMNPPFEANLVKAFVSKLLVEIDRENTTEAIVLTHNCTDSGWFHELANSASSICFIRRRVNFWRPGVEKSSPARGQVLYYFGKRSGFFRKVFSEIGIVMKPSNKNANKNGTDFEELVSDDLYARKDKQNSLMVFEQKIFYTKLKRRIKVDYFLFGISEFPTGFIIQAKFQNVSGSVIDKFRHVAEDIDRHLKIPGIIVVNDDFHSSMKKMIDELNHDVANGDYKYFLGVYTFTEYKEKFLKGFPLINEIKKSETPLIFSFFKPKKDLTKSSELIE